MHPTQTNAACASRFLTLPPEIRLGIYEQFLVQLTTKNFRCYLLHNGIHWHSGIPFRSLILVCRLIAIETLDFLYSYLTFNFSVGSAAALMISGTTDSLEEPKVALTGCHFLRFLRNVSLNVSLGISTYSHIQTVKDILSFLDIINSVSSLLKLKITLYCGPASTEVFLIELMELFGCLRRRNAGEVEMSLSKDEDDSNVACSTAENWLKLLEMSRA